MRDRKCYLDVNFKSHGISRDACTLTQTSTVITRKKEENNGQ